MPQAGIGAGNAVFIVLESTYGSYVDPVAGSASGIWVPILEEDLMYREDPYYSEQIRGEVTDADRKPGYYRAEGNITLEVDAKYMPYFLYASRHTMTKTGATAPYSYLAVPTVIGSAYPGGAQKGLSITIERNGVGFGYNGCVVGNYEFTIENGVLRATLGMLGLGEQELPGGLGTPTWLATDLLAADAHSIYIDAAGTAPTFVARNNEHNGFTFRANHNATAQNRIRPDRQASYIAFGKTEATYDTELDFLDKTEYTSYKNGALRSLKMESIIPGGLAGTWTAATQGFRIMCYRSAYDTYEVSTPGIGDIVSARVTGRCLAISGGNAFKFECKSPTSIT